MHDEPYRKLAERLDALPNGFPSTPDGAELRLLAHLFKPQEADLASRLRISLELPEHVAARLGLDPEETRSRLKDMLRRGLIRAGRAEGGLGYGLLPFVVGIYEMQVSRMDAGLARLFEDYYQQVFGQTLAIEPQVHRVIPVGETVQTGMEIRPYESAEEIIAKANAWGVVDCICRKQKELLGDPCDHPLDVCMMISLKPGAFDGSPVVHGLTLEEARATLRRAAEAGLVHSVTNSQEGIWYICNCCTCSCGILRGMTELGIANVVASSAFVNQVDDELCIGCDLCMQACQFEALSLEGIVVIDEVRCVGCGVCVLSCPDEALYLVRRPDEQVLPVPVSEQAWGLARAQARGLDLQTLM